MAIIDKAEEEKKTASVDEIVTKTTGGITDSVPVLQVFIE